MNDIALIAATLSDLRVQVIGLKERIEKLESRNKSFKPPTLEEVEKYADELKVTVDAQMFIDFYQSKGWMVGKSKMKDWKCALRRAIKDGWVMNGSPKKDRGF